MAAASALSVFALAAAPAAQAAAEIMQVAEVCSFPNWVVQREWNAILHLLGDSSTFVVCAAHPQFPLSVAAAQGMQDGSSMLWMSYRVMSVLFFGECVFHLTYGI